MPSTRLQNTIPTAPRQRLLTGVAGLDAVLHGGLFTGRIYLVDGNPGAGKTTLALQFLQEGARCGEACLYITLSESHDELIAGAASHDWNMAGIEVLELIAEGHALNGDSELTMYHPSEVELTETTARILEVVERVQPRRLVLDSLSELRLLAQSSLRYRRQILALKQTLAGRDCTVLMLDDRTSEGSDLQLQSIAHGVISLEHRPPAYGRAVRQLQVVKLRGSDFISGFQDCRITRSGLEVFPRLTAAQHGIVFRRESLASGIAALDALLGGGVDRGTATLLIGPPGSGKSTVALQYAATAAQRGEHAVIFAFEESRAILLSRAAGLGMTIIDGIGPGQISVRQIDTAAVSPGEFVQRVRHSVEADQARVVIIDSLNGYLNAMPEIHYLSAQLHELLAYLNNRGVATFLVAAQSGLLGTDRRSPIDASYLADAVVVMRMFEHEGRVKKAISVVKKRSGAHEETIRQIWFDSVGVHLGEPLVHLRGVFTGVPIELQGHLAAGITSLYTAHGPDNSAGQ